MSETRLLLESDSETLDLNELAELPTGVQAGPGMTGAGLPPVDVQWFEGAGDGATFQGVRVPQREMDIPITAISESRDELKEIARKIARVVAGRMTLRFIDDEEEWYLTVYRTGGGDFEYGKDTDGNFILATTITVTAESPYWAQDRDYWITSSDASVTLNANNEGSAPATPRFVVTGPLDGVALYGPNGETFSWSGLLGNNEHVYIDFNDGSVLDDQGQNRYAEVGEAPQTFRLPPGPSTVLAGLGQRDNVEPRTNYVTNPRFQTDASNGTANVVAGWGGYVTNSLLYKTSTGTQNWDPNGTTCARLSPIASRLGSGGAYSCSTVITGLEPGATYQFIGSFATICFTSGAGAQNPRANYRLNGVIYNLPVSPTRAKYTFFPNQAQTVIADSAGQVKLELWVSNSSNRAAPYLYIGSHFLGEPGAFFTGATTDTDQYDYAWAGVADASVSTATPKNDFGPPGGLEMRWTTKDWMVV